MNAEKEEEEEEEEEEYDGTSEGLIVCHRTIPSVVSAEFCEGNLLLLLFYCTMVL